MTIERIKIIKRIKMVSMPQHPKLPVVMDWEEMCRFFKNYYTQTRQHERFGQAFCNRYNVTDSQLFHANTVNVAMEIILIRYLKIDISLGS
jgi:hypothetical protein